MSIKQLETMIECSWIEDAWIDNVIMKYSQIQIIKARRHR